MKNILKSLVTLVALTALFSSCKDKYVEQYLSLEPVYLSYQDFRASVKVVAQHDLVKPGKIYSYGNYLFINESLKGVHVYNNANPTNPSYVGFINIPGNVDIVVKNDILYADSFIDLVAIDISQPALAKEVGRVQSVFQYSIPPYSQTGHRIGSVDNTQGVVVDWELKTVRKEIVTQGYPIYPAYTDGYYAKMDGLASSGSSSSSSSGQGGSMARFGLIGNSLVTVDNYMYYNFNLTDGTKPKLDSKSQLRGGIETMFLSGKYMFLGTTSGMYVYDLSDVNSPVYLSSFWHVTSCDPVVVQNNRAYITLRGGNMCGGSANRLDVLDITNILKPVLIRSYAMDSPYGLGISGDILFVCDGNSGLKVYNAADPALISENMLAKFAGINAYDVIPLKASLLMIGSDGFYQYDYSNVKDIRQISSLKIKK